jgi:hypothetical protein
MHNAAGQFSVTFQNTRQLRIPATCIFLFATLLTNAQTIRLDFEPSKPVIRFYFDSLTIYSDSTSLFYVYKHFGTKGFEEYDQRVKSFVLRQFNEIKADTIFFSGDLIPFNDGIDNENQNAWAVGWAIEHLTRKNLLKMYDKRGQLVRTIESKKIGTKKKGYVRRAFINKDTNEELFHELLFLRTVHHRYRH